MKRTPSYKGEHKKLVFDFFTKQSEGDLKITVAETGCIAGRIIDATKETERFDNEVNQRTMCYLIEDDIFDKSSVVVIRYKNTYIIHPQKFIDVMKKWHPRLYKEVKAFTEKVYETAPHIKNATLSSKKVILDE